jgi:iron(III) transport system substrate-binding protein
VKGLLALALTLGAIGAPGCGREGREVVIYTSVDQLFSEPALRDFEAASGVRVRAVFDTEETKSTGVLNRLIAEVANPQADVFWSGDPVRPFLLIQRNLVEPFASPAAGAIPAAFKDAQGRWAGVGARARVLLVNRTRLGGRAAPWSIRDLARPEWRGEGAIANPLFGTTTMQVAALAALWGEEEVRAFLDGLRENGVRIASSNGEVRRLVAAGEVTFGLTDTDDAHQAAASGAPVEIVYPDQDPGGLGTLIMPTTVVRIRGGPHPEEAKELIDHLLSPEVEAYLARHGAHMPLQPGVGTPSGVRSAFEIRAMEVDYAQVAEMIERIQPWLRSWVGL